MRAKIKGLSVGLTWPVPIASCTIIVIACLKSEPNLSPTHLSQDWYVSLLTQPFSSNVNKTSLSLEDSNAA